MCPSIDFLEQVMTDPKQQPKTADKPAAKTAKEEKKVFIRNNGKTPFVIPNEATLKPNKVTPVSADAWEAFKETPFAQSLIEEELIEESTEDEHAAQPKTEAEQLDENEAAEDAQARGRNKKSRK
jgi:hypothetical protein